jgi:hypothetical protein
MTTFPTKPRMPWFEYVVIAVNVIGALSNAVARDWSDVISCLCVAVLFYGWSSARRENEWIYACLRHPSIPPSHPSSKNRRSA